MSQLTKDELVAYLEADVATVDGLLDSLGWQYEVFEQSQIETLEGTYKVFKEGHTTELEAWFKFAATQYGLI